MKGLSGRVAVITGGANGIGKAAGIRLAAEGVAIGILDVDDDAGARTRSQLEASGARAHFETANVADEAQLAAAISKISKRLGSISILVNSAATFVMRGVDATPDEWRRSLDVNVMGPALSVKHVLPDMSALGRGSVVNVCSISSFVAQPEFATYNSSKGALATMTKCLALDLAPRGIRVNSVCPGTIWTDANANVIATKLGLDRAGADRHPKLGGAHVLQRLGEPEEVAAAIAFLASDEASFITGTNLLVDGGYTLQ